MTREEIKKICEDNNVPYYNHDEFDTPRYRGLEGRTWEDLQDAIIVVYPAPHTSWCLAINEDGSISRPYQKLQRETEEWIESIDKIIKKLENQ